MNIKQLITLGLLLPVITLTGCTIRHPIADDYPNYVAKNKSQVSLPSSQHTGQYVLSPATKGHRYEFRAFTVGYGHRWIVEFGKILDVTLNQPNVQTAFGGLTQKTDAASNAGSGLLFEFTLTDYEYKNHRAYVGLQIDVKKEDKVVFSRQYNAKGDSKDAQMFFGGPFAMTSATLASNRSAIERALTQFIDDLNRANI